jgi:hypothetical protein
VIEPRQDSNSPSVSSQPISIRRGGFRRPCQEWKCGLIDKGIRCPSGPDFRNRCPEKTCSPKRTLAWWRAYLPKSLAVVTIALILLVHNLPTGKTIVAPGPLTLSHAQLIVNPENPHRCDACHDSGTAPSKFNASIADVENPDSFLYSHRQSEKCLSCHIRDMPNLVRFTPHDLPKESLERLTRDAREKLQRPDATKHLLAGLMNALPRQPVVIDDGKLACSHCHIEHRGSQHDLTAITSERCQACHVQSFSSFQQGHPEFSDYPKSKPRALAFDHQSHLDKHFPKSNDVFDCRSCHVSEQGQSNVGKVFRSLSFEVSCAKCHLASIENSHRDGIAVAQVPSIDREYLDKLGLNVGHWPEEASTTFDGSISPIMLWEMQKDETMRSTIAELALLLKDDQLQLRDNIGSSLQSEDAERIAAFAQSSKRMFGEIASDGQAFLKPARYVGVSPEENENAGKTRSKNAFEENLARYASGYSPDIFRQAFEEWYLPHSAVNNSTQTWKPLKTNTHLPNGGWFIDRLRMSVSYIPKGHADPWQVALLELAHRELEPSIEGTNVGHIDRRGDSNDLSIDRVKQLALREILGARNTGKCTECHTQLLVPISSQSVPEEASLWRSTLSHASTRSITRFNHGPHLIQPHLQDCKACHSLDPSSSHNKQGEIMQALARPSEFVSMKKEQCAECHRPSAAGNQCSQCHNYHVNELYQSP